MTIARSWDRIVAWHEANTDPGKFRLNPGASSNSVTAFEHSIGAKLPDDFRESFLLHDGGDENCWILWHGEFLTLEGILKQWNMYQEWQRKGEYAVGKDWIPPDFEGPIKPVFWSKKRIHVTDNSGDHLTVDLDPPKGGTYGQIIEHSHEVGPMKVLAPSWSVFLKQLADDLDAGKYVYVEEEETVALPGMYD